MNLWQHYQKIGQEVPVTLSENSSWLEKITDTIPVIIYVYDLIEESSIYVNAAVTKILGYSVKDIQQKKLSELIHNDDIDRVIEHYKKLKNVEDHEVLELEIRVRDINNNWHWLKSKNMVLIRNYQGQVEQVVCTISNITEQKNLEFRLQKQLQCEKLIGGIAKKIHKSLNLKDILKTTVEEVRIFLNIDRVIIYQLKSDWSGVVIEESVKKPWNSLKGMTLIDEEFANKFIPLYKEGRIQSTADIYNAGLNECHINWLAQLQVKANLVIPILDSDDLWGLLVAQNCISPRSWEEEEIIFLQRLAIQVGIALEQAELYEELKIANQEWQLLATIDGLTNIPNRRTFDHYLSQEWQRGIRSHSPLSLILCDVDYFKKYNDFYGHQKGDQCLQQVAQILASTIKRQADLAARYGGEEFALILPNTPPAGAVKIAGEIRSRLRVLKLPHEASEVTNYVTISFGIGTLIPSHKSSPSILIEKADQSLYQAKKEGRDRIVLSNIE